MKKVVISMMLFVISLMPHLVLGQEVKDIESITITREQITEVRTWIKSEEKYQNWYKRYGNKAGWRQRARPEIPAWLPDFCKNFVQDKEEELLSSACDLLKGIDNPQVASIKQVIASQRSGAESQHTSFLNRVHFGVIWPITDQHLYKYGGLFESHISLVNLGRLEINTPGISILTLPNAANERVVRVGLTYGVSLRLGNVKIPQIRQGFKLYLNMANAWSNESSGGFGYQNRMSLMGLSVTLNK